MNVRRVMIVFASAAWAGASAAVAQGDWHAMLKNAETADLRHQYGPAIAAYKQALASIPQTEGNARAKAEAALSLALLSSRQYRDAATYGKHAVEVAQGARASGKFDPDVLVALKMLDDACEDLSGSGLPAGSRGSDLVAFTDLANTVRPVFHPPDRSVAHLVARSRELAGAKEYDHAEIALKKILAESHPSEDWRLLIQMYIAEMEFRQGRKELQDKLVREYKVKYSEARAMRILAETKMWLFDMNAARACIDKAGRALNGKDWLEESKVNEDTFTILRYKREFALAERCLRSDIAMLSNHKEASKELEHAKFTLAQFLKAQNRQHDADLVYPPPNRAKDYDFMLTDEERAAIAKERANKNAH